MVSRRDIRQRTGRARVFETEGTPSGGVVVYPPKADQPGRGTLWPADSGVALAHTGFDDIHFVPGRFVTTDPTQFLSLLPGESVTPGDPEQVGDLFIYTMQFQGIDNPEENPR